MRTGVHAVERRACCGLIVLLGLAAGPAWAGDAELRQARELLLAGKADAAYQLLRPLEETETGSSQFDYLYGVAALDAGHPEIAVFALERAVALRPTEALAHADLARAYLGLGEPEAAREELEKARTLSKSEATTALLDKHLNLLGADVNNAESRPAASVSANKFSAFLELSIGHDSNVNSATRQSQMAIPVFGGFSFSLDGNSLKSASGFTQLSAGASLQHGFSAATSGYLRAGASQRRYASQGSFNSATLDLAAGLHHRRERHGFSLALQAIEFALGGHDYRYSHGISGQWQYQLTAASQTGLFTQLSTLRYPQASLRNADRRVAGVFLGTTLTLPKKPIVYGSLYTGRETPTNTAYPYLGHHLNGIRLGGEVSPQPNWSAYVGLGFERRRYGGSDPLFLVGRVDEQTEIGLGASIKLDRGLSLRPALSYLRNRSNVPLNQFERAEVSISLRKEF